MFSDLAPSPIATKTARDHETGRWEREWGGGNGSAEVGAGVGVNGIVTLRFGLLDLGDRQCETAAAVATLLRRRGWQGSPRHPPPPVLRRRGDSMIAGS